MSKPLLSDDDLIAGQRYALSESEKGDTEGFKIRCAAFYAGLAYERSMTDDAKLAKLKANSGID